MISRKQKVMKTLALFLAFSLFQLYVQAGAAGSGVNTQDSAGFTPQASGKLSTSGNRKILVDKNDASTGATILDGATLETPGCVTAIVRLGAQGEIHLATNTVAVLSYSDGQLRVALRQGCAIVITGQNVAGTITTPDGKTIPATQTEPHRKRAEACSPSGEKSGFGSPCSSAPLVVGGLIGIGALAAVIIAAGGGGANRGENPSPSAPTL